MNNPDGGLMIDFNKVIKVKRKYEDGLLAKQNVVGCAVGYKEAECKETSDLSIIVYVTLKTNNLDKRDIIPENLDGLKTDVQESLTSPDYPISIASFYEQPERCSAYGGICRLECMDEQKIMAIKGGLRNKVDLALSTPVSLDVIETAVKKTGLFHKELEQQKRENMIQGERYRGLGSSIGRYLKPIDEIFPGAEEFMKALRELKGKPKLEGGVIPYFPLKIPEIGEIQRVGEPKLGMKVFKVGSTGITKGKISALDASIFVDYPPRLGLGVGNADFGEPIFSPSPLRGGRFPRDVSGIFCAYVPIKFVTEIHTCPWAGKKPGFPRPPFKRALFEEQIVTTARSKKEDSGAPLISENREFLGMHFAGSDRFSFFNTVKNMDEVSEKELICG